MQEQSSLRAAELMSRGLSDKKVVADLIENNIKKLAELLQYMWREIR